MRDLIFVSLENWDEIWRRNQLVCAEWARRHPLAFAVAGSNVSTVGSVVSSDR
jgi:hypothetical protein